ncbi:MAG: hypothetical protein K6F07_02515 [Bacilli bacterium]|nr:hypothetical protein [Bacilli bacterium]
MGNKFKTYVTSLGFNYKSEIIFILIGNLFCILISFILYYYTKQLYLGLASLLSIVVINAFLYIRYSSKKKAIMSDHEEEFVTIITYFQIFVSNNFNVYTSFKSIIPYCSEWMADKINIFLFQIDSDKTIKPFIDFANNFKNAITHNVMLSIYQMVDEGSSGAHMLQFSILFDQLSRSHQRAMIDKKDHSLGSLASLPLVGAGAITLLITFGIMSIMGEMINVL